MNSIAHILRTRLARDEAATPGSSGRIPAPESPDAPDFRAEADRHTRLAARYERLIAAEVARTRVRSERRASSRRLRSLPATT
jgi:hypothetical protein